MNPSSLSLIFSAGDQATYYKDGGMFVRPFARLGSLTAVDFSQMPPQVWHEEEVPCSVIGPPTCVAGTKNGKTILVAGAMEPDSSDVHKLKYGRTITLLRLSKSGLRKIHQMAIGAQPSGIVLCHKGQRAYVTLRAEGKIVRLDIAHNKIQPPEYYPLARPEDSLSHFAISKDETKGLVTLHNKGTVLALDMSLMEPRITQEIPIGLSPYDIKFFSDGLRALVADTQKKQVTYLVYENQSWRTQQVLDVGRNPEGISISSDNKWVAISCFEGANSPGPDFPWYHIPPRIYVFLSLNGELKLHQLLEVDSMPQSAVFSPDGNFLIVGQYGLGNLRVYKLENNQWNDTGLIIETAGQPGALATSEF